MLIESASTPISRCCHFFSLNFVFVIRQMQFFIFDYNYFTLYQLVQYQLTYDTYFHFELLEVMFEMKLHIEKNFIASNLFGRRFALALSISSEITRVSTNATMFPVFVNLFYFIIRSRVVFDSS